VDTAVAIELARRASFVAEAMAIVVVGKMFRDLVLLARGYKPAELLTVKDNHAAAIDLSGFLLALVVGVLGSLVISSTSWLGQAADIAMHGLLVIGVLLLNDLVTDKAILRGIDDHAEIVNNRNAALAIARAASAIATGLVIRGALGHGDALTDCLVWVVVGQVALVVIALLYQRLTPYDDLAEIRAGNVAAAWPIAGILLAVGITVEAAVHGETHDWAADLASVGIYLGLSVLLLGVLRVLTEWFLLSRARLSDEIARDKNVGAGLIEATAFVVGAEILSFFLT